MKLRQAFVCAFSLIFAACSQKTAGPQPQFVNPEEVKSILQTETPQDQSICEQEIQRSGGKTLYKNEFGLLFANLEPGALILSACRSLPKANLTFQLPKVILTNSLGKNVENDPNITLTELLKLIPGSEIGARAFIANNPNYDGRKVTIAVLDTGIELDHPMLTKTPSGEDKVVAFEDFSGEGLVNLISVPVKDGMIRGTDGKSYSFKNPGVSSVGFGIFQGSTLQYADALSKIDSFKDIAVIAYKTAEGIRGRIDTDGDQAFDDEAELYDYSLSKKFTKIGDKKSLTVSLNVAPDLSTASLCFDDGAHGTHVSGIAAGFDPGGLRGVAPGAKIVLGKIGDNRLSGGSSTTASMLLAIDFAVRQKAQVTNMSYGISPGSNVGNSDIEKYVDKVAKETGMIFSISAGNEGPGLLTVGTPAGAHLAITNGAYISKDTAHLNYGYQAFDDDNIWFFSSIGPRFDGGWKPTLLAPGSALSSVPLWDKGFANYRGTSMASPEVTGGIALILSAALQSQLPSDRVSVTQAVYRSAAPLANLAWIEQGHGLMNVPAAYSKLAASRNIPAVEFDLKVNSPTAPDGQGTGIYVRSRSLPQNLFSVKATPQIDDKVAAKVPVSIFRLVPSAPWIKTPAEIYMQALPQTFQVELDDSIYKKPGLYSEKVSAIDQKTGETAFEIPVTVVAPITLNNENQHSYVATPTIRVGHTQRYFFDVPAGATSALLDLTTDGPPAWMQWLDPEGRTIATMQDPDPTEPFVGLSGRAKIARSGVYELDVIAPPNNQRPVKINLGVKLLSLPIHKAVSPAPGTLAISIQNNYEPVKFVAKIEQALIQKQSNLVIDQNSRSYPIALSDDDKKNFQSLSLHVETDKSIYDLMTDYPYRLFDRDKRIVLAGGLELNSKIALNADTLSKANGPLTLEIQGAFAQKPPTTWGIQITENWIPTTSKVLYLGQRALLETEQATAIYTDIPATPENARGKTCLVVSLSAPPPSTRLMERKEICP